MARRQPVPTNAIRREIRKALAKLYAKQKKASLKQLKAINLEIKVLEKCFRGIGDIWLG